MKAFLSDQWKEIEEKNRMGKTRDLFKKTRDTKGTFHAKMGSIQNFETLRGSGHQWIIPWRRGWQPTPEFLPGKSHGQRSLVGSKDSQKVTESQTRLRTKHSTVDCKGLL